MRHLAVAALLCLVWNSPAHATALVTYDAGSWGFSFLSEDPDGRFFVAGAVPADWIESLTTPPDCRVTYILFDALFTFGKNEVEAFGVCSYGLWGDTTAFFEPFDHFGTYTNGYATVTISEVPDLAGSAVLLLFSLGALVLYRRPRIRHQWMV